MRHKPFSTSGWNPMIGNQIDSTQRHFQNCYRKIFFLDRVSLLRSKPMRWEIQWAFIRHRVLQIISSAHSCLVLSCRKIIHTYSLAVSATIGASSARNDPDLLPIGSTSWTANTSHLTLLQISLSSVILDRDSIQGQTSSQKWRRRRWYGKSLAM